MHDEHPHPLLAQVPLTISPFLALPTSVPLPYSYRTLPSTLPASILSNNSTSTTSDQAHPNPQHAPQQAQQQQTPAYVTSASGTSAHPDTILSSCLALQQHLQKLEDDARNTLRSWEERRQAEDLAEKRRLAPGWLDSGVHILKPEEQEQQQQKQQLGGAQMEGVVGGSEVENIMDDDPQRREAESRKAREGEELDRVFGGLQL